MLENYIKIAFRNFFKNKSFTFINVFGIVSGMTVSILILQYVAFQFSFDDFIEKAPDIYRVRTEVFQEQSLKASFATSTTPIGPVMKSNLPEVLAYTRLYRVPSAIIRYKDVSFNETEIFCIDPSFFNVFDYPLVKGSFPTDPQNTNAVVVSQSVARKYFGEDDPINKIIELDGMAMTVKGVIADLPDNSHIKISFLFPFQNVLKNHSGIATNWEGLTVYTYILLRSDANPDNVERKLNALARGARGELFGRNGRDDRYYLQPLKDIHLYSHHQFELGINGDGDALYLLSILAVLILGMAWLNYVSLSTISNLKRIREIGVRLVMGARRIQLINQFLWESILINLVAAILSLIIAFSGKKMLEGFLDITLPYSIWLNYKFWVIFVVVFFLGVLVSGGLPALIVSRFKPYDALKSNIKSSFVEIFVRRGFTLAQFVFSAFLITSTIIITNQMFFVKNHDIGIDIKETMTIRIPFFLQKNPEGIDYFMNEIRGFHTVKSVTNSSLIPGVEYNNAVEVRKANSDEKTVVNLIGIDNEFLRNFQVRLVAGRGYDKDYRTTNNEAIIINEAAAKLLAIQDLNKGDNPKIMISNVSCEVIGIAKNFNQKTVKSRPDPVIFYWRPRSEYISVKGVTPQNFKETAAFIESKYKSIFPVAPFEYLFLKDLYNKQYKADEQFMSLFEIFATLAIIISSLGLLGLNMFNIKQRTKEIGVRKVLGASIIQILVILLKDLMMLVLFGSIIAWIVVYFVMSNWLHNFAEKVNVQWWWYLASGMIIFVISILVVSYHTVKASRANPVKALRSE